MGQTIAEALREERVREGERQGKLQGCQDMLGIRREERFGALPANLLQRIANTREGVHLRAAFREARRINSLDKLAL